MKECGRKKMNRWRKEWMKESVEKRQKRKKGENKMDKIKKGWKRERPKKCQNG